MNTLRRRRTRRLLGLILAATLLSACGGDAGEADAEATEEPTPLGFAGTEITELDASLLPPAVLGLEVTVEDVEDRIERVADTYVERLSLFAFRRDDLLMATLQVSELGGPARVEDPAFRRQVVNLIGGSTPREVRLGDTAVWLTTGTNQRLQSWFNGDHFFVLSIRSDYERPRALLRELLEVQP